MGSATRSFLVLHVVALCLPIVILAETKTITAEAIYTMGDGETPAFAESMVLLKAKQRALEEAGTYVQSYTHVRNLDVTVDEIKTIAGGILEVSVIEKKRELLKEGGERFYTRIRALVTTDRIEDLARRIKGGGAAEENKKVLDAYAQIGRELEVLKRQVVVAKTDQEKEIVLEKIRDVEKQFRQVKSTETALFKRLLSGEELSEQVSKAFAEKQKAKEEELRRLDWQNRSLDHFLSLLRNGGFAIAIGSPDTHVELDRPEDVTLGFHVSIRPTQDTTNALSEVQRAWKGNFPVWVEPEIENLLNGRLNSTLCHSKAPAATT